MPQSGPGSSRFSQAFSACRASSSARSGVRCKKDFSRGSNCLYSLQKVSGDLHRTQRMVPVASGQVRNGQVMERLVGHHKNRLFKSRKDQPAGVSETSRLPEVSLGLGHRPATGGCCQPWNDEYQQLPHSQPHYWPNRQLKIVPDSWALKPTRITVALLDHRDPFLTGQTKHADHRLLVLG